MTGGRIISSCLMPTSDEMKPLILRVISAGPIHGFPPRSKNGSSRTSRKRLTKRVVLFVHQNLHNEKTSVGVEKRSGCPARPRIGRKRPRGLPGTPPSGRLREDQRDPLLHASSHGRGPRLGQQHLRRRHAQGRPDHVRPVRQPEGVDFRLRRGFDFPIPVSTSGSSLNSAGDPRLHLYCRAPHGGFLRHGPTKADHLVCRLLLENSFDL